MPTATRTRRLVARVEHTCDRCLGTIKPGQAYVLASGKGPSGPFGHRQHERTLDCFHAEIDWMAKQQAEGEP